MIENLVIVESPAKAKTIEKFLGKDYTVKSSFGHIRDLEKKNLGIDIEHDFTPKYEISADKKSLVKELKSLAKEAKVVWLASDEDREGEAIAWHLYEVLELNPENTKRIVFHEITKDAILNAIKNYRNIDLNLVDAQQARRILDRLVGFEISPILWKKIKPSLSAGRVQSVAVKLIVEREREINNFKEQKYFKTSSNFICPDKSSIIKADLNKRIENETEVKDFLELCKTANFVVSKIEKKPSVRRPSPPFTTSTLQQEASRQMGFSVSRTMSLAQKLYERGLITYMRTDSVNLSSLAINTAKKVIIDTIGEEYSKPRNYSTNTKGAQEAHEAIRPTYLENASISGDKSEQMLYSLIYKRTLASQMANASLERTNITIGISDSNYHFSATGEMILFDGFLKMYIEGTDDENQEEKSSLLPKLSEGDILSYSKIQSTEQYTQHPPRYTEATLVKKMETLEIGRPSTYAPTITTIQNRNYVLRESREGVNRDFKLIELSKNKISDKFITKKFGSDKKKLFPTNIGIVVTDFLTSHFQQIMDYNFTAKAEDELDEVARGKKQWQKMIGEFYSSFYPLITDTLENADRESGERELGIDPSTGEKVSVRIGRFGPLAQIGEGENIRYAGLKKEQLIENITLEEALDLFKFPRQLGEFEDKKVSIGIGRFGPYIRHDGKFVSLKKDEDEPTTITLETAIQRIEEKREADRKKLINEFEGGIKVLNGRWGPYISFEKTNYKILKTIDAEKLTLEECKEIIAKGAPKTKRKSTAKKTTAKKTTAKKTTAKKTTAKKSTAKKTTAKKDSTKKATTPKKTTGKAKSETSKTSKAVSETAKK